MLPGACHHEESYDALQPALTRVNRQVRKECLPIFYYDNSFKYHLHGCDFTYFFTFIHKIGLENRKHIQSVTLNIRDRFTCGNGLANFVMWCATAQGTDNMVIGYSGREWHLERPNTFAYTFDDVVYFKMMQDLDHYDGYLGPTMKALDAALEVAQRLSADGKPTLSHVKLAWKREVANQSFDCQIWTCVNEPFERFGTYAGHDYCSLQCDEVDLGADCAQYLIDPTHAQEDKNDSKQLSGE